MPSLVVETLMQMKGFIKHKRKKTPSFFFYRFQCYKIDPVKICKQRCKNYLNSDKEQSSKAI